MKKRYVMRSTHKEMRGLWYLTYSALSLCLLVVMVFLPLAPAFADEVLEPASSKTAITEDPSITEPTDESVNDDVDTTESSVFQDEHSSAGGFANNSEVVTTEDSGVETEAVEPADKNIDTESLGEAQLFGDEVTEELVYTDTTTEDTTEVTPTEDETISEDPITDDLTDTEEVTDDTEVTDEVAVEDTDDTSSELESDADTEATTTADESTVVYTAPINNDNKFSFSENECTTAGDGTFYCVKADAVADVTHTDRIFATTDAEGDKEIYVEKSDELSPLTENQYDDDAPYYDELSNTAVWHRLIDGRYQIISFDFDKEKETQLTNDRYNNMEPHRFGDITVWQGWVGNDWEIFLLEGTELTMLTDNTTHDITPGVNGTHVVWQSFENNTWVMKVYDIRSQVTTTIDDEGGGSIENPRFVLVYDSKQETGDIETRGYDLKSGEVIALGSTPVNLPDEIPDPDQTGEERALVTITQLKPKTEDEGGDEPLPDTLGTSTPNGTGDIVIPGVETSSSTQEVVIDEIVPGENDVVVAPLDAGTTTDTSHIEDVIVTPYVEPIASADSTQ